MTVAVGTKAPDFTLPNQDLQPVTLSAHLGRKNTVLAFFPAAFTSVCTKEMCTFRDSIARLNTADAVVYGISVDTPFTLKVFAKEQGLTFPLLSDFNKDVIHRYGVVIEDLRGSRGSRGAPCLSSTRPASFATAKCSRTPAANRTTPG